MPHRAAKIADPEVDRRLRAAIEQRRLIRLRYHGKDRILEPHDYGMQNGRARLLAYQIAGSSTGRLPNWRWFDTGEISDLELLDKTFLGSRTAPSGKHHKWDEIFIRVASSTKAPPPGPSVRKCRS